MASNWIDEIFEKEWFVVTKQVRGIGVGGHPDIFTESYVSTSPYVDRNREGYKLMSAQRWYGSKEFEGYIEHRLMRRVVDLHNADLARQKAPAPTPPRLTQGLEAEQMVPKYEQPPEILPATPRKKRVMSPEHKAKFLAGRKAADERRRQAKEAEAQSGGTVPQGQPVQAESGALPQEVQPQAETQEPRPVDFQNDTPNNQEGSPQQVPQPFG